MTRALRTRKWMRIHAAADRHGITLDVGADRYVMQPADARRLADELHDAADHHDRPNIYTTRTGGTA